MKHKPKKKGDYVAIDGALYPVTGKLQEAAASGALKHAGRHSAPIEHWDGSEWNRTGAVLHAAIVDDAILRKLKKD